MKQFVCLGVLLCLWVFCSSVFGGEPQCSDLVILPGNPNHGTGRFERITIRGGRDHYDEENYGPGGSGHVCTGFSACYGRLGLSMGCQER